MGVHGDGRQHEGIDVRARAAQALLIVALVPIHVIVVLLVVVFMRAAQHLRQLLHLRSQGRRARGTCPVVPSQMPCVSCEDKGCAAPHSR